MAKNKFGPLPNRAWLPSNNVITDKKGRTKRLWYSIPRADEPRKRKVKDVKDKIDPVDPVVEAIKRQLETMPSEEKIKLFERFMF